MRRGASLVAIALALLSANAAHAVENQVVANSPAAFTTPRVVAQQGDTLRFRNLDPIAGHDVDSEQPGRFGSPVIPFGQSTLVEGVEKLSPGDYGFLCSVHPNMRGTLSVIAGSGGGDPSPSPPPDPGAPEAPNPVTLLPKAPLGPPPEGGDWPSYGRDLSNSRNGGSSGPSYNEVPRLGPAWIHTSKDGDYTGTPVVADGTVVVGSSGGTVSALDAHSGKPRWSRDFDKRINASAAVNDGVVYIPLVVPGRPSVAALDASDGRLLWESVIDTQRTADAYGSPTVWNGRVFIGTSGYFGEQVSEVDVQARGSVVALDARSGERVWKTYTVPEGHDGGAVWSTPAVDPEARRLFVGTGNAYHDPAGPMTDSMLMLDPDSGKVLDHFQAVSGDAWNGVEDWPENPDADFGSSPNLFTAPDGRRLVGQGAKSGLYWALDRRTMDPVWKTLTGPGTFTGGIIGSTAVDDDRIYGTATPGALAWALHRDGRSAWTSTNGGPLNYGAVSVANGVAYANDVSGALVARDATTGLMLARLPLGAPSWGGVSIAGGTVFTATGTGGTGGYVFAFRPR
jgi:polyvinyl alcohol dehydrogenase (cytochrome)